jgi:hypothetical protein
VPERGMTKSQLLGTSKGELGGVLPRKESSTEISVTERSLENPSPSWWVPPLLAIPALIPLISSIIFARRHGLVATGFIEFDQPFYVANARAYFDQGFHLLYGNPYAGYDTPRIYFQPHFFLVGSFQQLGLDPGVTWNIFSALGTLFAAFVAVNFYREVVGWRSPAQKLGLLCFFWGGGVLVWVGLGYASVIGKINAATVLHFDPANGWWMLNFGRNLVYGPTEAYYHGIFLLCMLFLLRRRFGLAIAFAVLLSISHPFTGIESSMIVPAYLVIERIYGDRSVKTAHLAGSVALFLLHVGYYMVFLNRFAEHRIIRSQLEAPSASPPWLYQPSTFLPALFIVGLLGLASLWRWPGFRQIIQDPRNRLFLVWFVIVFAITQHYRFMKPIMPIHFAHGYDWMALFFLGSPLLVAILERLLQIEVPWLRGLALSTFLLFFLSDNMLWFGTFLRSSSTTSQAIIITAEQKEVLNWLSRSTAPRDMVVTADAMLGYLVSTYTRVRSWAGYKGNTPYFKQRALETEQAFQDDIILPAWTTMDVFYVQRSHQDAGWKPPAGSKEVFRNAGYAVWECPPPGNSSEAQH